MADWLLIAAALLGLYSIVLLPLRDSERWKERGVTVWGPVPIALFLRTTRGLNLLDRLSRPKRFWRLVASAGIPLVVLSMSYFLILVLLMAYIMVQEPPQPSSYNAPRNILLIPGLNEYIPFVWGWIALLVTMVVHEFAHGILSRVEGVRIRSMGIVALFLAPIAAFVEPDEDELFGTKDKPPIVSKGARIRILSAGVIANFIVAAIAMALFFGPVIGSISPLDRVIVVDVKEGSLAQEAGFEKGMVLLEENGKEIRILDELSNGPKDDASKLIMSYENHDEILQLKGEPAQGIIIASVSNNSSAADAGLSARMVITKIDGVKISGLEGFRAYMNSTQPRQRITLTTGDGIEFPLELKSYSNDKGIGFIGIELSNKAIYSNAVYTSGVTFQQAPSRELLATMKAIHLNSIGGIMYLLSLPFAGISGFSEKGFPGFSGWLAVVFEPTGWAEPLGGKLFWIANLLLWIGWINLYAGLFNCLPAVPLDGGHIFRDLTQAALERLMDAKKAEKVTRTVVAFLAWIVLTSIVITVIAPFTHDLSLL